MHTHRFSFRLKFISLALVGLLLWEQTGMTAVVSSATPVISQNLPLKLSFPESVATIEDVYTAPDASQTLIILQDAHTNPSGQLNLAQALDIVLKEVSVKTAFTEAAVGDNSLGYVKPLSDKDTRHRVAESLVMKGLLHGAEYLSMTGEKDFNLWGVEDVGAYAEGLRLYKDIAAGRAKALAYLDEVRRTMQTVAPLVLNESLLLLETSIHDWREGKILATDHVNRMMEMASANGISLDHFSALKTYARIRVIEKAGGDLSQGPELDAAALLEDAEQLQELLVASLVHTEDEAMFMRFSAALRVLKNMAGLQSHPRDFEAFLKHDEDHDIRRIAGFLNKKIMDADKHYDRALFLDEAFETLILQIRDFYALTYRRDLSFVEQSLERMRDTGEVTAVLIAGGFHAESLKALLKQRNVSYISVIPHVLHETDAARYEKLLLGQIQSPASQSAGVQGSTWMSFYVRSEQAVQSEGIVPPLTTPMLHGFLGISSDALQGSRMAASLKAARETGLKPWSKGVEETLKRWDSNLLGLIGMSGLRVREGVYPQTQSQISNSIEFTASAQRSIRQVFASKIDDKNLLDVRIIGTGSGMDALMTLHTLKELGSSQIRMMIEDIHMPAVQNSLDNLEDLVEVKLKSDHKSVAPMRKSRGDGGRIEADGVQIEGHVVSFWDAWQKKWPWRILRPERQYDLILFNSPNGVGGLAGEIRRFDPTRALDIPVSEFLGVLEDAWHSLKPGGLALISNSREFFDSAEYLEFSESVVEQGGELRLNELNGRVMLSISKPGPSVVSISEDAVTFSKLTNITLGENDLTEIIALNPSKPARDRVELKDRRGDFQRTLDKAHENQHAVFVAKNHGAVVGYGEIMAIENAAVIGGLYVRADMHHRRIGTRLFEEMVHWFQKTHPKWESIMVADNNEFGYTGRIALSQGFKLEEGLELVERAKTYILKRTTEIVSVTGKRRILLVDDEEAIRNPNREFLTEEGFEVEMASNGEEAWKLFQNNVYHLVITDNDMFPMSGEKLIKNIRGSNSVIPIILYSASVDNPVEGDLNAVFLSKSARFEEILDTINRLVPVGARFSQNNFMKDLRRILNGHAGSPLRGMVIFTKPTDSVLSVRSGQGEDMGLVPLIASDSSMTPRQWMAWITSELEQYGYSLGAIQSAIQLGGSIGFTFPDDDEGAEQVAKRMAFIASQEGYATTSILLASDSAKYKKTVDRIFEAFEPKMASALHGARMAEVSLKARFMKQVSGWRSTEKRQYPILWNSQVLTIADAVPVAFPIPSRIHLLTASSRFTDPIQFSV